MALAEKSIGELGELRFCANALERGIVVCTPFGDNCAYDAITEYNGVTKRVQIKASGKRDMSKRNADSTEYWGFTITKGREGKIDYNADDFDVLVAYIIPLNITFIIPSGDLFANVTRKLSLNLLAESKWAGYNEAWEHLRM